MHPLSCFATSRLKRSVSTLLATPRLSRNLVYTRAILKDEGASPGPSRAGFRALPVPIDRRCERSASPSSNRARGRSGCPYAEDRASGGRSRRLRGRARSAGGAARAEVRAITERRQAFMEQSARNRRQPVASRRPRKRLKQGKTVATGCDQLPARRHGKEAVPGSSPGEGLNTCKTALF
jgi:hypothetical protein